MTFQHPEYNWAFLLLLIPILIHLLKFRREPTLYFPGVFRLKEILKSSQKSKRIRHWLILITRLALWSLIILTFSKPSLLPNSQSSFTSQTRLVLWDNSPSMWLPDANGKIPAEEAKKSWIQWLAGPLSLESTELAHQPGETKTVSNNKDFARELEKISSGASYTDLRYLIPQQGASNYDVWVVTDGAKDAIDPLDKQLPKKNKRIFLFPHTDVYNVSIDSAWTSNINLGEINVQLSRNENASHDTLEVRLFAKGDWVKSQSVFFKPKQSMVSTTITLEKFKSEPFELRINTDEYKLDNHLYCHPLVSHPIAVFLNKSAPKKARSLVSVLEDRLRFTDSIQTADATWMIGDNLPKFLEQADSLSSHGISTVIYPYSTNAIFGATWGEMNFKRSKFNIDYKGLNRWPFDAAYTQDLQAGSELPKMNGRFNFSGSRPLDWQTVLNTEDGKPFLLKKSKGDANIWMFLGSFEEDESNWVSSAWFLSVMGQLLFTEASSSTEICSFVGTANFQVPQKLGFSLDEAAILNNKQNKWNIPLSVKEKGLVLDFLDANDIPAGHYELSNPRNASSLSIGLNSPRRELLDGYYTQADLEAMGYTVITPKDGYKIGNKSDVVSSWDFVWKVLVFIAVIMEMLLLQRRLKTNA